MSREHQICDLFESLETRCLLSADFGVEFQEFSPPSTLVPGDRFVAGIILTNNGPMNAAGQVTIQFYLSEDVTLSGDDLLTGSYPNQQIPGVIGSGEQLFFSDDFTVPRDAEPGDYFLLARIIPSGSVGDSNQSNNIVASADAFPLEIIFGAIPGRDGTAVLELLDPEGTIVQFQLFDGGTGTVSRDDDGRFDINVTGAGANSRLGIATSGGDGIADIDDINIAGSMSSITGTSARLLGSLAVSGTLGTLTLGNVGGTTAEVSITIGQSGVNTVISLGEVRNASISTPGGIESLSVASWADTNASPVDLIEAQWLNTLISAGAFGASIELSGRTGAPTLGGADIGGSLTGGSWVVVGRGGTIEAMTSTPRWSASFSQVLTSLTIERVFRGTIAAKNFTSVLIGVDLQGAEILAGTNLGADGRLGGAGEDADSFAFGRINALTVGRRVKNSLVGAGLDPVDGVYKNGDDTIRQPAKSRIGNVVIISTMAPGARIVAGRFTGSVMVNGAAVDPAVDARFRVNDLVDPGATLVNSNVSIVPSTIRVRFTDNIAVLRSSIGSADIRIDGPDGLFSLTVELVGLSRPVDGSPIVATFRFTPPGGAWDPTENGSYSVVLLGGGVTDTSGNAVADGMDLVIGSFNVAV